MSTQGMSTQGMATRYFALIVGIVYALVGVMGLLGLGEAAYTGPALGVPTGQGTLLGLFPVNIVHNIVHLAIGLWGIASYRNFSGARVFARGLTILYVLLAVMGLLPFTNTTFGLVPIFGNDIWLHALTAAVAAYFGFFAPVPQPPQVIDASRARR